MKNFVLKFMVSYAAMLGTFCIIFFGLTAVVPNSDHFGIAIFGCIMSVTSLIVTNALIEKRV
jgi:hypothetical protein